MGTTREVVGHLFSGILPGMNSIDFYLCSDPGWGNASEIVSALAAVAAAAGTILGVAFAYNRYKSSLDDKRREQAKFVHAYFEEFKIVEELDVIDAIHRGRRQSLPEGFHVRPYVRTEPSGYGRDFSRALKRVVFCKVTVENRSEEMVTNVYGQLSVWEAMDDGIKTGAIGAWEADPYLLPKSSKTFWVAVPYEGSEDDVRDIVDPILFFTDANGHTWTRSPFGPPEEFNLKVEPSGPSTVRESKRQANVRDWSDDELLEVVSERHPDDSDLILEGRSGRGATFMGRKRRYSVHFALNSDEPVVIAQSLGPDVVSYMRRQLGDESSGP